jgi:hypothetical protein
MSLEVIFTALFAIVSTVAAGIIAVVFLALIGLLIFAVIKGVQAQQERKRIYKATLAKKYNGRWRGNAFTGVYEQMPFEVNTETRGSGDSKKTVWVARVQGIAKGVELKPEHLFTGMLGGEDHVIGDHAFDSAFQIQGDDRMATALFSDPRIRTWIRRRKYGVRIQRTGHLKSDLRSLSDEDLHRVLQAAVHMKPPADLNQKLQQGWENTNNPDAYRAASLRHQLMASDRQEAETVARKAINDSNEYLRATGAAAIGKPEGTAVLLGLLDEHLRPQLKKYVVKQLGSSRMGGLVEGLQRLSDPKDLAHLLDTATQAGSATTALAAAQALAKVRDSNGNRQLTERALFHVSQFGDAACEPILLALLARGGPTRLHAILALGRTGSISAVEALHAIREEGGGVLFDSAASRHADTAIAAIQARMGDVEAGRLAVADVQINEGALSEAVQAGQLSTTKKRQ